MALRGRGRLDSAGRSASTCRSSVRAAALPRVTLIADRRRIARARHDAAAEGRLAELRTDSRCGRGDAPGDPASDSAEAVWAAVATGKLPQKNGVRSASIYRAGGRRRSDPFAPRLLFRERRGAVRSASPTGHSSATFRARTLWSLLSARVASGVVNWPLTYPAPPSAGTSSATLREAGVPSAGLDEPCVVYPPELQRDALPLVQARGDAVSAGGVQSPSDPGASSAAGQGRSRVRPYRPGPPVERPTQVTIVRYQSLDPIGHYFLRYAAPSRFGDVSRGRAPPVGPVLERHYRAHGSRRSAAPSPRSGPTTCCSSFRHTEWSRSDSASGCWSRHRRSRTERYPRGRPRRLPDGVRSVRGKVRLLGGPQSSTSRRRCCTSWACRRPRHGRLRAEDLFSRSFTGRSADCVHPDL